MNMARIDLKSASLEPTIGRLQQAVAMCKCVVHSVKSLSDLTELGDEDLHGVLILESDGQNEAVGYTLTMLTMNVDLPVVLYLHEHDEVSELVGLRAGACDVLSAKMSSAVISERIMAAFRRETLRKGDAGPDADMKAGSKPPLVADVDNNDLWVGEERVEMTCAEVKFLEVLISRKGGIVRREELAPIFEGIGRSGHFRSVDNIVKRIRQKMRDSQIGSDLIQTVYGSGYRLSPDVISSFRITGPKYA